MSLIHLGSYVAMELRSPSSEMYRKMLKREIHQSITQIELDDLNSVATCSTKMTEAPSPDCNQCCVCQQLLLIKIY